MSEDLSMLRSQRRIRGYRLAKRRTKPALPTISLNVDRGEKVHRLLREKVIRLVLDALPYPNPAVALGLGSYNGKREASRMDYLFSRSYFPAALVEKYQPVLDAIDARRLEEQNAEFEDSRSEEKASPLQPELFSDGSDVALPVAESDDC